MTKRGLGTRWRDCSTVDLRKKGLHLYSEHPDTKVWCVCFAIDDGPIQTWLPAQPCPPVLVIGRSGGELWSHNAAFEREIWTRILTPRYGWPSARTISGIAPWPLPMRWRCQDRSTVPPMRSG